MGRVSDEVKRESWFQTHWQGFNFHPKEDKKDDVSSVSSGDQPNKEQQPNNEPIHRSINQSVNRCLETFYADSVLFLTLPKGEENDRFDCEKLKHWIIRAEHISRGLIKQEECIQSQRNCYVVHYCDVKITTVRSEMGSKNKKRQSDKNQEN